MTDKLKSFTLKLDTDTHFKLKMVAHHRHETVQKLINDLIAKYIKESELA